MADANQTQQSQVERDVDYAVAAQDMEPTSPISVDPSVEDDSESEYCLGGFGGGGMTSHGDDDTEDSTSTYDAAADSSLQINRLDTEQTKVEISVGLPGSSSAQPECKNEDGKERGRPSNAGEHEHFTAEEFGQAKMKFIEPDRSHRRRLFAPIRPRQYFIGDILYRERKPRKVTWDELFLDLIYVAVINRMGYILKEDKVTGQTVNKFLLVFIPVWLTWIVTHYNSNRFGAESFVHRLFSWANMILVAGMGTNAENAFNDDPSKNTANVFIITFLITRVLYIIYNGSSLLPLPQYIWMMVPITITTALSLIPWFVSIFVDPSYRVMLWWLSWACDFAFFHSLIAYARIVRPVHRIALNIEHHVERLGLLTVVVLGEMVVGLLWSSSSTNFSGAYFGTILGMFITITFQYIYFNIDGGKQFIHAVRRSAWTAVVWQTLHLALHCTITAVGAILAKLVLAIDDERQTSKRKPVDPGKRWVFVGGAGLIMWLLTLIGLCHKWHQHGVLIPKNVRLGARVAVGAALFVLAALGGDLSALQLIGVVTALVVPIVGLEEYGRLRKGICRPNGPHNHAHNRRDSHTPKGSSSPSKPKSGDEEKGEALEIAAAGSGSGTAKHH
ncbi:hypothetical protein HK102_009287 [Quaeritorhiza haematococci]|nr:hypothetical protein HK102_009287 [Quaeritorhiza haematococci]